RDPSHLPRVRRRAVPRRAGLDDGAHAAVGRRRRARRRAAASGGRRAAPRLRPLHPRVRAGRVRARDRHAARERRARLRLGALRAGGGGADPSARRGEALPAGARSRGERVALPASAHALALAAAVVHATWNLLLAQARDPEAATAVALVTAAVVGAPAAALWWSLDASAWPFVAASSGLE